MISKDTDTPRPVGRRLVTETEVWETSLLSSMPLICGNSLLLISYVIAGVDLEVSRGEGIL